MRSRTRACGSSRAARTRTFVLADLRPLGIGGCEAETVCDEVGISLNKNSILFDPMPPMRPSGIRVGTLGPATLGMDEAEMKEVAGIVGEVLRRPEDDDAKVAARERVRALASRFPVYPG